MPFDEIHREVLLALMDADFVNGHDVRMLQAGRRRSFRAKPLHELRAGERTEEQHLHRDDAVQAYLPRPIDNAHPASRDFFQQFVIAERAREFLAGGIGFDL